MKLPYWFRKNKIIILLFHSVVNEDMFAASPNIGPDNHISSNIFEKIVSWLSDTYTHLCIDDALRANKSRRSCVVITFDDGFRDNLYVALPILEKYKVPATIYITSGFIDRSVYPFEYNLATIVKHVQEICLDFEAGPGIFATRNFEEKLQTYLHLKNKLKFTSNEVRQRTLKKLDQKYDFSTSSIKFLSKQELLELSKSSLITIGSHTHYHQVLSSIPESNAKYDIQKGKAHIEDWIGKPVHHFSYPYGTYNQKIAKIVHGTGFKSAVTTKPGVEQYRFKDPMTISRFEIKNLEDFHSATASLNK